MLTRTENGDPCNKVVRPVQWEKCDNDDKRNAANLEDALTSQQSPRKTAW